MRALWLEDRQLRFRDDVPAPTGDALVRVLLAGICNTDIEMTRGYYPFAGIPGHEFVGEWNGKRVVGEINAVCHSCDACRKGRSTHCERRTVLGIKERNGAFAEHLALPPENLHEVPDGLSNEEAIFTEPLAAALQIQQQVEIRDGDRVLVVGDGKLGQLIAQTLAGRDVTVIGHHRGTADRVPDRSMDIAIDCTGKPEGFAIARRALRPRGTLVMKSTYAGDLTFNASAAVVDEITIVGSRCGPFKPALDLLARRVVDVRPLIEATYRLEDGLAAFEHAQRPGALKVLLGP